MSGGEGRDVPCHLRSGNNSNIDRQDEEVSAFPQNHPVNHVYPCQPSFRILN
jgi:hypothetical protein